ncbi:MAG: hypothetical protein ACYCO3_14720, partial [Mycobacteriales bacterium]
MGVSSAGADPPGAARRRGFAGRPGGRSVDGERPGGLARRGERLHAGSAGAAGVNYYVSSDATLTVQVDGTGGIPASGVSAVALELTLSSGMGGGSLLAFNSDGTLSDTR